MRTPEDIGDAMEQINKLRIALQVVLDQVDYTHKACKPNEMVGACLSTQVLDMAHKALEDTE
jgi:hypothetical protein